MNQTTKASKHFPITTPNRHDRMRVFLLSQPESERLHRILAGCAFYPHLLLSLTRNYLQRIRCQRPCRLTDGVFVCLPVAGGRVNTFIEVASMGARKAVRWWVKHRLWDRSFWGSKLGQQGRPTIFGGWTSPIIPPVSPLTTRRLALSPDTPAALLRLNSPILLRGNHAR